MTAQTAQMVGDADVALKARKTKKTEAEVAAVEAGVQKTQAEVGKVNADAKKAEDDAKAPFPSAAPKPAGGGSSSGSSSSSSARKADPRRGAVRRVCVVAWLRENSSVEKQNHPHTPPSHHSATRNDSGSGSLLSSA